MRFRYLIFAFILFSFIQSYSLDTLKLKAPDNSIVMIIRDEFGVPHIQADNEAAMFFGQGFAVAQDRTLQLEMHRRTSTGTMSEIGLLINDDYTEFDKAVRREYYQRNELISMFEELDTEVKTAIIAYSDGINRFLDSAKNNPSVYKHYSLAQLEFIGWKIPEWKPEHTVAVMVYFGRVFGSFGGEELERMVELKQNGTNWFEKNRPINDTATFTTIPDSPIGKIQSFFQNDFNINPIVLQQIASKKALIVNTNKELNVPNKFGSFAVIASPIKSVNNSALMLGCPQMGTPQKDIAGPVNEVELTCPTYHCGGISVAGVPFVLVGRNEKIAWTFTSGLSDNNDVFIDSVDFIAQKSFFNNGWVDVELIHDTVKVLTGVMNGFEYDNIYVPVYRTIHGPIIGEDYSNNKVYSLKSTFYKKELKMFSGLYKGNKANSASDFEEVLKNNPMSFNSFVIDGNNDIYFWHSGYYVDRSDGIDPRLPRKGDGTQEWKGIMNFDDLPKDKNNKQGYYVNWNNKPSKNWNNGDNIPWTSTNYLGTNVENIDNFIKTKPKLTYNDIKIVPFAIQAHGTYQQSVEMFGNEYVIEENILPPGQSEFRNTKGEYSTHLNDQWARFNNWQYKEWYFGALTPSSVEKDVVLDMANYPNPFSNNIEIKFFVPSYSKTTIEIFDSFGRRITTLADSYMNFGEYRIFWNGRNSNNDIVADGAYFINITTNGKVFTSKIIKK